MRLDSFENGRIQRVLRHFGGLGGLCGEVLRGFQGPLREHQVVYGEFGGFISGFQMFRKAFKKVSGLLQKGYKKFQGAFKSV